MSVVALASAKGAPGVTTTALALAVCWPPERRVLIVEADPSGGDLAAWLDLAANPSAVSLAAAGRRGLDPAALLAHARPVRGLAHAWVLTAPPEATKARVALDALASSGLFGLLESLDDTDVVMDVGRLAAVAQPVPLPARVGLLCGPTLHHVAHARGLIEDVGGSSGLVVVGDRPYTPTDVAGALGVPLWAALPHDRRTADALRDGGRVSSRSPLLRACAQLARELASPHSSGALQPSSAVHAERVTPLEPTGASP